MSTNKFISAYMREMQKKSAAACKASGAAKVRAQKAAQARWAKRNQKPQ
jgi:hypothetical protein